MLSSLGTHRALQEAQASETHNPHIWRSSRLRGVVVLVKEMEVWDLKTDVRVLCTRADTRSRHSGGEKLCEIFSPCANSGTSPLAVLISIIRRFL